MENVGKITAQIQVEIPVNATTAKEAISEMLQNFEADVRSTFDNIKVEIFGIDLPKALTTEI